MVTEYNEAEVSVFDIGATILRYWRLFVVVPLVLVLLVALWTLTRPERFVASATFMPQDQSSRASSGALALAQQFGVNLTGGSSSQSPQYYVQLLEARAVRKPLVESEYTVNTDTGPRRATLIELFAEERGDGRPTEWRGASAMLNDRITTHVDSETGLVELRVTASQPGLAEQIAARFLELLNEVNTSVLQQRAEDEGRFIGARVEEAHGALRASEAALQSFLAQNRDFSNSPQLQFEYDRLQRQVAMRQEVYTSMARAQEQASIDAIRDVPMVSVVDVPQGSAVRRGSGLSTRVVLATVAGFALAALIAFLAELARRGRAVGDPSYREFDALRRKVWQDIRHPRLLVRRGGVTAATGRTAPDGER